MPNWAWLQCEVDGGHEQAKGGVSSPVIPGCDHACRVEGSIIKWSAPPTDGARL